MKCIGFSYPQNSPRISLARIEILIIDRTAIFLVRRYAIRWKDRASTVHFIEQRIPLRPRARAERRKKDRFPFAPFHFAATTVVLSTGYIKSKNHFYLIAFVDRPPQHPSVRTLIAWRFHRETSFERIFAPVYRLVQSVSWQSAI